jgi:mono/diheme cytochrome c family protein
MLARLRRFGAIVIAGSALAAGFSAAFGASADNGKRVYMAIGCVQCHGTVGQGGAAGPKIAPDPMPYDALAQFVRTTARSMPPYRETVLSNADLADIYAYLQSIPKSPHPKEIPLLNQ